jgi:hypothetical protein
MDAKIAAEIYQHKLIFAASISASDKKPSKSNYSLVVAKMYGISPRTVRNIWSKRMPKKATPNQSNGQIASVISTTSIESSGDVVDQTT